MESEGEGGVHDGSRVLIFVPSWLVAFAEPNTITPYSFLYPKLPYAKDLKVTGRTSSHNKTSRLKKWFSTKSSFLVAKMTKGH